MKGVSQVLHTSWLFLAERVLQARQSYSTLLVTSLSVMRGCKILMLNFGKRQLIESGAHLPAMAYEPLGKLRRETCHMAKKARPVLSAAGSSNK